MRFCGAAVVARMTHSPLYEALLETAWQDLVASVEALCAEMRLAPPAARLLCGIPCPAAGRVASYRRR